MNDAIVSPDSDPTDPNERDEILAAEHVLGLLDADQARALGARQRRDAGFARLVQGWHERLALLAGDLPETTPPARVKAAIDAAIAAGNAPAAPARTARRTVWRPPLRRGLWLTGAAAAAAIALAWVLMPGNEFHPDYRAAPANAQLAMRIDARIDSASRILEVQMTEGAPPPDGDMELWWIAAPDATPVSLGVVPASGRVKVHLTPDMVPSPQVVLAVTAEPRGGSAGRPAGPVVASAPITPV